MTPNFSEERTPEIITHNPSCGIDGLQPYPGAAPDSEADGVVDMQTMFVNKATPATDVVRSYGETFIDAVMGWGARLEDWTLGANRNGFRGMADEPLPARPPIQNYDGNETV